MLTGVILAGGKSSRMGTNKALLPFGGERLINRQIRLMSPICTRIVVVANRPLDYESVLPEGVQIIPDHYPDRGPISGLHAALLWDQDPIWVVGCDQPFLSAKAAQVMMNMLFSEEREAVIPVLEGRAQMLHAIYHPSCAMLFDRLIRQEKYRLTEVLEYMNWKSVDEPFFLRSSMPIDFAFDMDTPEEYRLGLKIGIDR